MILLCFFALLLVSGVLLVSSTVFKNKKTITSRATENVVLSKALLISGVMSPSQINQRAIFIKKQLHIESKITEAKRNLLSESELAKSIGSNSIYRIFQIQNKIEKYETVEGILSEDALDDFNSKPFIEKTRLTLNTPKKKYTLFFTKKAAVKSGQMIHIKNALIFDSDIIVDIANTTILQTTTHTQTTEKKVNKPSSYRYAIVPIKFANVNEESIDMDEVKRNFLSTDYNSPIQYYKSAYKVNITFSFYPWYTITDTTIGYCDLFNAGINAIQNLNLLENRYIFLFNTPMIFLDSCQFGYNAATTRVPSMQEKYMIVYPNYANDYKYYHSDKLETNIVIHEIGHTLSFTHAGKAIFYDDSSFIFYEYGNTFDPMGAGILYSTIGTTNSKNILNVRYKSTVLIENDSIIPLSALPNNQNMIVIKNTIDERNNIYVDLKIPLEYDSFSAFDNKGMIFLSELNDLGNMVNFAILAPNESFFDLYSGIAIKHFVEEDTNKVSISYNNNNSEGYTYSKLVDLRGVSYCVNLEKEACINDPRCKFFEECNMCGAFNTNVAYVCKYYCAQLYNENNCKQSIKDGNACEWNNSCNLCVKNKESYMAKLCKQKQKISM